MDGIDRLVMERSPATISDILSCQVNDSVELDPIVEMYPSFIGVPVVSFFRGRVAVQRKNDVSLLAKVLRQVPADQTCRACQ